MNNSYFRDKIISSQAKDKKSSISASDAQKILFNYDEAIGTGAALALGAKGAANVIKRAVTSTDKQTAQREKERSGVLSYGGKPYIFPQIEDVKLDKKTLLDNTSMWQRNGQLLKSLTVTSLIGGAAGYLSTLNSNSNLDAETSSQTGTSQAVSQVTSSVKSKSSGLTQQFNGLVNQYINANNDPSSKVNTQKLIENMHGVIEKIGTKNPELAKQYTDYINNTLIRNPTKG